MRTKYCYITLTYKNEVSYLKLTTVIAGGVAHKAYFTKDKSKATIFAQGKQSENYILYLKQVYKDRLKGELGIEQIVTRRR